VIYHASSGSSTIVSNTTEPITTALSTSVPTSSHVNSTHSISAEAAVGVGIGSAVAGAALAITIAFLCLGWTARKRNKDSGYKEYSNRSVEQKPAPSTTLTISKNSSMAIVESHLPQPLPDKAISDAFSKVSQKIEGHVLGFYKNNRPFDYQSTAKAVLQTVGTKFPLSLLQTTRLLENGTTRPVILRAVLGHIVADRMDMESPTSDSFLPPIVSMSLQSIELARGIGSSEPTSAPVDQASPVYVALMNKWRTISAFLFQGLFDQQNWTETDLRNENVRRAIQLADTILRPYATAPDDRSRLNNLELIMQRAARLAYTLFSQPSIWSFDWQSKEGEVAVFPALLLQVDGDGKMLSPPRVFEEGKTART
jgi:hypothetical protein